MIRYLTGYLYLPLVRSAYRDPIVEYRYHPLIARREDLPRIIAIAVIGSFRRAIAPPSLGISILLEQSRHVRLQLPDPT